MTNNLPGTSDPLEPQQDADDGLSEFGESLQGTDDELELEDWSDQDLEDSTLLSAPKSQATPGVGVATLWTAALVSIVGAGGLIWSMNGSADSPGAKDLVAVRPKPVVVVNPEPVQPVLSELAVAAPSSAPASALVPDESDHVRDLVEHWRQAWVAGDVPAYLGFYSPNFVPPGGQQHAQWVAARRKALSRPAGIEIKITSLNIERLHNGQIKVLFLQDYTSGRYREVAQPKTLLLARSDNRWLIAGEWQGQHENPPPR